MIKQAMLMKKQEKKILFASAGVLATGAIVTTALLILRRVKQKRALQASPGHSNGKALTTTTSTASLSNFINWYGGRNYLANIARGIRNNNPGNLIRTNIAWKGKIPQAQSKDNRFEMFSAPVYGVRAMIMDLKHDIAKGKNTVPLLISEYAPKSENNTENYINIVCKDLKVSRKTKLIPNKSTLRSLVFSISRVENGGNFISDGLFEKAYQMI
jgi:hypothetical protein